MAFNFFIKKQSTLCYLTNFKIKPIQKNLCFFFLDHLYFPQIYFSGIYIYIPMNIHAIAKKQAKHEVLFQFLILRFDSDKFSFKYLQHIS